MWKDIRVDGVYKKKPTKKYTPTRSQKSFRESSFSRLSSKEKQPSKQIKIEKPVPFQYRVTNQWVIKLQKKLKGMFKQFRVFCKSIENQMERMNSNYRNMARKLTDQILKIYQQNSIQASLSLNHMGLYKSLDISKISPTKNTIISPLKKPNFVKPEEEDGFTLSESTVFIALPTPQKSSAQKTISDTTLEKKQNQTPKKDVYDETRRLAQKLRRVNRTIEEKKRSHSPQSRE